MSSFVGQSFILPMTKAVRCGVFGGKLRCVGLVYLGFADPCVFLFNFEWSLVTVFAYDNSGPVVF